MVHIVHHQLTPPHRPDFQLRHSVSEHDILKKSSVIISFIFIKINSFYRSHSFQYVGVYQDHSSSDLHQAYCLKRSKWPVNRLLPEKCLVQE